MNKNPIKSFGSKSQKGFSFGFVASLILVPFLTLFLVTIPLVSGTDVFSDGFESGSLSKWVNASTPSVQSTIKHHGVYAAKFDNPAWTVESLTKTLSTGYAELHLKFSEYIDTLPATNKTLLLGGIKCGTGDHKAYIECYNNNTAYQLRCWSSLATTDYAWSVIEDSWYDIEVAGFKNATGWIKVWLNGTLVITQTGDTSGYHNWGFLELGMIGQTSLGYEGDQWITYVDCVKAATTDIGLEEDEEPTSDLTIGLPAADVYIVENPDTGNFVTINGSDTSQYLEFNNNAIIAIEDALSYNWVPQYGTLVTNGTFNNWQTDLHLRSNFTWEAWQTAINVTDTTGDHNTALYFGQVSNVFINNLTINGNYEMLYGIASYGNTPCTNNSITNSTITRFNNGIYLTSVTSWAIDNSNVSLNYDPTHAVAGAQIYLSGTYCNITDNYLDCNGDEENNRGIGGILLGADGYNYVYNNTILDWNSGIGLNTHGIYASSSAYSEIAFNNLTCTVTNSTSLYGAAALHMKSSYLNVHDNIINITPSCVGVTFYNESQVPTGFRCVNNTITLIGDSKSLDPPNYPGLPIVIGGTGNAGGDVDDGLVENNTITGLFDIGIQIVSTSLSTNPINNVTIQGNRIIDAYSGIAVGYDNYDNDYVQNVNITGNTFLNVSGDPDYTRDAVINVFGGAGDKNITICENTFTDAPTSAVAIINSKSNNTRLMESAIIYNNTGIDSGTYRFYTLNGTVSGDGAITLQGLSSTTLLTGMQYPPINASVTWDPDSGYSRSNFAVDGVNQNTTISPILILMNSDHNSTALFSSTVSDTDYTAVVAVASAVAAGGVVAFAYRTIRKRRVRTDGVLRVTDLGVD